jgi:hypothetical protein
MSNGNKKPQIKQCPICRLVMVGEKSDAHANDHNIFRCLACELTITFTPPPPREHDR